MKKIRITEKQLQEIITKSVKQAINESFGDKIKSFGRNIQNGVENQLGGYMEASPNDGIREVVLGNGWNFANNAPIKQCNKTIYTIFQKTFGHKMSPNKLAKDINEFFQYKNWNARAYVKSQEGDYYQLIIERF